MKIAIIALGIGYFVTCKVPEILKLRGTLSTMIKIIGILLLILGVIDLAEYISELISHIMQHK